MTLSISARLTFPQVDPTADPYNYHDAKVIGLSATRVVVAFVLTPSMGVSTLRLMLLDQSGVRLASTDLAWIGEGLIVSGDLDGEMPQAYLTRVDDTHLLEVGKGFAATYPYAPFVSVRRIFVADGGFTADYEVSSAIPATADLASGYPSEFETLTGTGLGLVLTYCADPASSPGAAAAIMAINTATGVPSWVTAETFQSDGLPELLIGPGDVTAFWADPVSGLRYMRSWTLSDLGATPTGPAVLDPTTDFTYGRDAHINPAFTDGVSASLHAGGDFINSRRGAVTTDTASIVSGLIGVAKCSARDFVLICALPE